MPEITVGSQIFDIVFHPTHSTVYTGLLTGQISAYSYDEQGQHKDSFTLRPSKRSCRGLSINHDGNRLWAVGKAKELYTVDAMTGTLIETRKKAHNSAMNRVKYLMPHMISTGDDDGVIKLWDTRKSESTLSYNHHFDFISDFLWIEDKKQLVSTSGDGTLSVIDVRGNKAKPLAQSEDQEDELLSIVSIKHGSKVVVGTQTGILSIFNRSSGWGDCVDRVPGHLQSIDALCPIPSFYPSSSSTILTGSSDGLLRVVQLFPTKLVGVIADHGEFPIERIAIDQGGNGRWVGSAGHEEVLRLTNLKEVFEDEDKDGDQDRKEGDSDREEIGSMAEDTPQDSKHVMGFEASEDEDSDGEKGKKGKRKRVIDPLAAGKRKKGRNELDAEASFFSQL